MDTTSMILIALVIVFGVAYFAVRNSRKQREKNTRNRR